MKHISEILIEKAFELFMEGELSHAALNKLINTAREYKIQKDSVNK